jgi:hypothetical protein
MRPPIGRFLAKALWLGKSRKADLRYTCEEGARIGQAAQKLGSEKIVAVQGTMVVREIARPLVVIVTDL